MQVAGRGLARLRTRPILLARSLHGVGDSSAGGGKDAGSGGLEVFLAGAASGGLTPEWKAETWRSPTPLFGGPGLLGGVGSVGVAPGVIRGYNSFVGKEEGSSKDAAAPAAEDEKKPCCDHDHGDGEHKHDHDHAPAAESDKPTKKAKREMPAVLKEEDEDEGDETFDITSHPIWNQESIAYLLENNKRWVGQKTAEDPEFFKKLASVHKPEFLFIGCSDARLSVQHMLGLEAGELFVHRNVANMVMPTDLNLLTVLTYAVDYLKVKHIIVCGHYDCGGVRAAMKNHDHGLIENWIMGVRDVARLHRKELKELDDNEAMHRRLVELNVQEQCVKLYANPVMQKSQAKNGFPYVHAMVFDVGLGLVKELDIDFKAIIRKYRHVYSMYNFKERPTP